jgi:hypothetical protein
MGVFLSRGIAFHATALLPAVAAFAIRNLPPP